MYKVENTAALTVSAAALINQNRISDDSFRTKQLIKMKQMSIHLKEKPMTCRDTESNWTGRAAPKLRAFANKLNLSWTTRQYFCPHAFEISTRRRCIFICLPQPHSGLNCSREPPAAGWVRRTGTASRRPERRRNRGANTCRPLPILLLWLKSYGLSSERFKRHVWLHLCPKRSEDRIDATWSCVCCTTPPPKERPPSPVQTRLNPQSYKHFGFSR